MRFTTIFSALALAALTMPAAAQQNMIPGTDVELGLLEYTGPGVSGYAVLKSFTVVNSEYRVVVDFFQYYIVADCFREACKWSGVAEFRACC